MRRKIDVSIVKFSESLQMTRYYICRAEQLIVADTVALIYQCNVEINSLYVLQKIVVTIIQ